MSLVQLNNTWCIAVAEVLKVSEYLMKEEERVERSKIGSVQCQDNIDQWGVVTELYKIGCEDRTVDRRKKILQPWAFHSPDSYPSLIKARKYECMDWNRSHSNLYLKSLYSI